MKTHPQTFRISFRAFSLALALAVLAFSGQSCAAATHASNAATHSGAASVEAVVAAGDSGAASVQVVTGVAAVPLWMSGAVVASGGTVSAAVGNAATKAGSTVTEGAEKMWDFASGDPAQRPAMKRERAVPVEKKPVVKAKDPSPADALKTR